MTRKEPVQKRGEPRGKRGGEGRGGESASQSAGPARLRLDNSSARASEAGGGDDGERSHAQDRGVEEI